MTNLTPPARDRETCDYCDRAQAEADWPLYRAQCVGCAVRALAQGPLFHAAGVEGSIAAPYRKALAQVFGDDWRNGHERVKAEHARIKAARDLTRSASGSDAPKPLSRLNSVTQPGLI
ncbi:hypothetical protein [Xenophilus sp. Marseille-Q4582]|uniref:hypothetical protein n=1 Tax=Xenophilus sp. Marseille-Q4582 TaxID=2866600 RepID=UPI001CE4A97C|nr:hypothetical protein [Xenophilus sp. Marseille-Q4582]